MISGFMRAVEARPGTYLVLGSMAFFILAILVLHSNWLPSAIASAGRFFFSLRHEWLDPIVLTITFLGDTRFQVFLFLLCGGFLYISGAKKKAVLLLAAGLLLSGCVTWIKAWLDVARPEFLPFPPPSRSFPSGHTAGTAMLALGFAFAMQHTRYGTAVVRSSLTLALLVAFSRLYLGVHWLSDVLAGVLLAFIVCSAMLLLERRWPTSRPSSRSLLPFLSILAITWAGYSWFCFEAGMAAYAVSE